MFRGHAPSRGDRAVRTHVAARMMRLGRGGVVVRRVATACSACRALPVPVVRAGRGEGLEGGMRCVCAYARGLRAWSQYRTRVRGRACGECAHRSHAAPAVALTRPLGPCDASEPLTRTCGPTDRFCPTRVCATALVRTPPPPSARHRALPHARPAPFPRPAPRAAQPRATGPPPRALHCARATRLAPRAPPPAPPACGRVQRESPACGRSRRESATWARLPPAAAASQFARARPVHAPLLRNAHAAP